MRLYDFLKRKKPERTYECDGTCGKEYPQQKLYKFTWRYNDKVKKYTSGYPMIHTGYKHLCMPCLKKLTQK